MQHETASGDEDHIILRRPKPRGSRKPTPTEAAIQIAIKQRLTYLGCFVAHVPNAGKRTSGGGYRLKREGMVTGFPDLLIYRNGHHALLEVKRPGYSPSDVSDAQREIHATLARQGFPVAIVTGQDEAIRALEAMGWVFR